MRVRRERRGGDRARHRDNSDAYGRPRPLPCGYGETAGEAADRGRARLFTRRAALAGALTAVSVLSDVPDWQPHVAQAEQIAATGVPLLTAAAVVDRQIGQVIAAGATLIGTEEVFSQIGYEMTVQAQCSAASATPFVSVNLLWEEGAFNTLIDTDTFIVPCSSNVNTFTVLGKGPSKADRCTVSILNLDSAHSVTVSYTLMQNSRVYDRDRWHWYNGAVNLAAVPGFVLPTVPADESVLGMVGGQVIGAGASTTAALFGMYDGLIGVGININVGTLANLVMQIAAEPNSNYVANNPLFAGTPLTQAFTVAGVRAPLRVILNNTGTTSMTVTYSLVRIP